MASFAIVLYASRFPVVGDVTVGFIVSLALLPVWIRPALRYRGALALGVTAALAVATGLLLSELTSATHQVSSRDRILQAVVPLAVIGGVGLLLWGRSLMPDWQVAAWFSVGAFLAIRSNAGFLENSWRFGFSFPTICLTLALAWATRRRWVEGVACIVLIGVSAWAGGRSRSAVLVLVLLLLVVQSWKAPRRGRAVAARMGAVLVACAVAAYQFGQAVILEGYLGEAARERSQAQIEQSGSLIVGGRPEMAATVGLVRDTPFGFGLGVQPDMRDVAVAKDALRTIQYDPDNGYVERYMFGNGFELHSVLADLWARYSVGGLLFGIAVLVMVGSGLVVSVAGRTASAVAMFAGLTVLWDLPFSPLTTSIPVIVLGVSLLRTPPKLPGRPPP